MGNYLAAAAQAVADGHGAKKGADGKTLSERLDYLIDELSDCQKKRGTGYIFGATLASTSTPEKQFDIIEKKSQSDTWVPWYTMHKILNGLVETYKYTGNKTALSVAEGLGEWVYNRTEKWTEDVRAFVLGVEYGGMNDCLYELYTYAKADGYADAAHFAAAAHSFDEDTLFELVQSGKSNVLNGRHANCTIPKFIGALNRYRTLKGENVEDVDKYLGYAESFWKLVVNHHSYITGGNSECEYFGADDNLDRERSNCNCETCNSHNMLKLAKMLYEQTGDKKYADYYETTFLNSIMASVNEETGMTTYFQPMATGLWKVYCNSDVEKNYFWCCTGTGLENFTKLGDAFYYHTEDGLVVNQYISSQVEWKEKSLKLTQDSGIPNTDTTRLTVHLTGASQAMKLYLRVPGWTEAGPVLKINGAAVSAENVKGYLVVDRTWSDGDKIELKLPMTVRAYSLPDNNGKVYGFKYGPLVLAAELGTDGTISTHQIGVQCDVADYKYVAGKGMKLPGNYGGTSNLATLTTETLGVSTKDVDSYIANIAEYMVKDTDSLTFTLKGTDWTGNMRFSPYYRIHDQRYGIYWLFSTDVNAEKAILNEKTTGRDSHVYLDGVGVGYTEQTEGDDSKGIYPRMIESNSEQNDGNTARRAKAGGSFSYLFKVDKTKKNYLVCKFSKEDNGAPITITAGGTQIVSTTLNYSGSDDDYTVEYEIPDSVVQRAESYVYNDKDGVFIENRDVIRISFAGTADKASAWVYNPAYTRTAYSTDAGITSISCTAGGTSRNAVKNGASNYTVTVAKDSADVTVSIKIADTCGLLYVNGELTDDSQAQKIALSKDSTEVGLTVYAEDHTTKKDYTLTIVRTSSGSEQSAGQSTAVPKASKIKSKTAKKKGFTVKFKKISGVTGYQVQYSLKKNFRKSTTKAVKKTSFTVKKLKSKKTYYVRVRTYKTVNGEKVYSKWSKKVKVKTK